MDKAKFLSGQKETLKKDNVTLELYHLISDDEKLKEMDFFLLNLDLINQSGESIPIKFDSSRETCFNKPKNGSDSSDPDYFTNIYLEDEEFYVCTWSELMYRLDSETGTLHFNRQLW